MIPAVLKVAGYLLAAKWLQANAGPMTVHLFTDDLTEEQLEALTDYSGLAEPTFDDYAAQSSDPGTASIVLATGRLPYTEVSFTKGIGTNTDTVTGWWGSVKDPDGNDVAFIGGLFESPVDFNNVGDKLKVTPVLDFLDP
jgi:hypothetical protein